MSSEAPGSPGVGSQLAGADVSGGFCSGSPFQSPVPPLCPWSSQHLRQSFSLWTVTPAAWGLERPQEQGGWSTVGTGRPDDAWVLSAGWGWRGCPPALALEACLGHSDLALGGLVHPSVCTAAPEARPALSSPPLCSLPLGCLSAFKIPQKLVSAIPCRRFPFPRRVCYSVPSRRLCGSHGFAAGRPPSVPHSPGF